MSGRAPRLSGLRVVVVGAGRSGLSAARLCAARGAQVTLCDDQPAAALSEAARALLAELGLPLSPLGAAALSAVDLVVLSPGVPPAHPAVAAARAAGVAITGELELASRFIEAPLVAITGTNGKSTVTSLCGAIATATGRPTFVGGNLGTPLGEAVGTAAASADGLVVCEVSSFQLETAETFHPRAAAILNLTPDHLDRHGSMEGYGDAKFRIAARMGRGDLLVENLDDPALAEAHRRHAPAASLLGYSVGGGAALAAAAAGVVEGDQLVLRLPAEGGGTTVERYATADLPLVGRHNLGNALAALLLLRGARLCPPAAVRAGAAAFRPLPHRMELVGERAGVRYYDDSKGTNVAAVCASIDGFPRPFVLIAGGRDKGGSYAPLREAAQRNTVRAVVVIGEAAGRIAEALEGAAPIERAGSMEEAVGRAAGRAGPGEAVVLSPACSSYDMFRDYLHRGQAFRAAVEKLPDRR